MKRIPLSVLAWEGPQARAYLVALRRAQLVPAKIVLLVRDPRPEPIPHLPIIGSKKFGARAQNKSHNHHPIAIRKNNTGLIKAIEVGLGTHVQSPGDLIHEMYDGFDFQDFGCVVELVRVSSYRDPRFLSVINSLDAGWALFTGGGILPSASFGRSDLRILHIHTGFLPHVRGADVLLWSLLVRGRPGVSAFEMTPNLDDGDMLAAEELAPLEITVQGTLRPDDETLYRSLFSFVDPLIRAEFLTNTIMKVSDDLSAVVTLPQDIAVGTTFHFMDPAIRRAALARLFPVDRMASLSSTAVQPGGPGDARRYSKAYEKPSMLAPLKFAIDASRAGGGLRSIGLRNRQADYGAITRNKKLLALHSELNSHLEAQAREWPTYDYGEGYFYQSSMTINITGLRDTSARVEAMGLIERLKDRRVLEIGCNTGFLTAEIAASASEVHAFELNPHLVAIANLSAQYRNIENISFSINSFEEFEEEGAFDDVLSFANHHTYDGNTSQALDDYFARCHRLTKPGGRLLFESHPPELEGGDFPETVAIIKRYFEIDTHEVPEYGTFLDRGRHFIIGYRL
ncbi:MAG: methyltransferase domain-containing protein [Actinomycetes bacterium]